MEPVEDFEHELELQNFKIRRAGAATLEHLAGISTREEREARAAARKQAAETSQVAPQEPSAYERSGEFLLRLGEALA